jgi:hypothetical protein
MRPTLKRPHIVQTALNDAELAALRQQADREGLSVTAFLRQLVIKNTPVHLVKFSKPPGEQDQQGK